MYEITSSISVPGHFSKRVMKVVKQLLNINSNFGAAMIRTSTSSSELIQHSNNTRRQCQNV